MPARDVFHNTVRVALEKDGWAITHDPLFTKVEEFEFYIDLGAERTLGAEKAGQKIAVEIKSFLGPSEITELYSALGKFSIYESALIEQEPDRILYLAVSKTIYDDLFSTRFIQKVLKKDEVKILIFDEIKEEVLLWKE
jgi:hypothetical protein